MIWDCWRPYHWSLFYSLAIWMEIIICQCSEIMLTNFDKFIPQFSKPTNSSEYDIDAARCNTLCNQCPAVPRSNISKLRHWDAMSDRIATTITWSYAIWLLLLRYVKSVVYKSKSLNLADLRGKMTLAIKSVTSQMLNNVRR